MPFLTRLDYSDNRQLKQHVRTFTVLSGATSFGVTFSALTTGPNLSTSGVSQSFTALVSTFSGNSGTTNYSWYTPIMSLGASSLSAITPLNSGSTQQTGQIYTASTTTVIDGHTVALAYTGLSFDINVIGMVDMGGGNYSGSVLTNNLYLLSANTLDFTGRTIWADVSGITRTQDLIITNNPQIGYVWTCIDAEGKGQWSPSSGSSSGSTSFTGDTYWISGSSGTFSLKAKNNSGLNATGAYALAEGSATTASGSYSHAEGGRNIASGQASHAEGTQTTASGSYSHAEGYTTLASGQGSHAEGGAYDDGFDLFSGGTSFGMGSHSEGVQTTALGVMSHAEGYLSVASGYTSHAEGEGTTAGYVGHSEGQATTAYGNYSHSEGVNTTAFGNFSHAQNNLTIASGTSSHAEGSETSAIGSASHAEGIRTTAMAIYSHAEGSGTTASGVNSHAEGDLNIASGYASHAEGSRNIASGDYSHVEGVGNLASGYASHVEGGIGDDGDYPVSATSYSSHAEGIRTLSSGVASHAEGNQTTALGHNSHSEGGNTTAVESLSHAEGGNTTALGTASHAEGSSTTASGGTSHAEGANTIAGGIASHAEGNSTTAFGYASHAGGANCTASGFTSFVHGSGSTANGFSTVVFGNAITGTSNNTVYVPDLIIDGLINTDPLATDANGKIVAGVSDARLKKNINKLYNALDKIKNLRGVSFEYTTESNMGEGLRYGFIAQEVIEVIPEIVRQRAKSDGMLNLNYTEIIPYLVEAVKELSTSDLKTQTILAEDNNIYLNYSGTPNSAIGGGIRVLHAMGNNIAAEIKIDTDGNWFTNNDFKSKALTIPLYTPSSSKDKKGNEGNITRDDDYLYIKTKNGWKRSNLENF